VRSFFPLTHLPICVEEMFSFVAALFWLGYAIHGSVDSARRASIGTGAREKSPPRPPRLEPRRFKDEEEADEEEEEEEEEEEDEDMDAGEYAAGGAVRCRLLPCTWPQFSHDPATASATSATSAAWKCPGSLERLDLAPFKRSCTTVVSNPFGYRCCSSAQQGGQYLLEVEKRC
jgi:hypothetical protein